MEFKKISVNGISYGDVSDPANTRYIRDISNFPSVTNVNFRDQVFFTALNDANNSERAHVEKALILLSLCHNVIVQKKNEQLVYNASSPDELALINFAKFCGVEYRGIDEHNNVTIFYKEELKYKLEFELEFNSTRKRQSVILRDEKSKKVILLCKGADSFIFDRIRK